MAPLGLKKKSTNREKKKTILNVIELDLSVLYCTGFLLPESFDCKFAPTVRTCIVTGTLHVLMTSFSSQCLHVSSCRVQWLLGNQEVHICREYNAKEKRFCIRPFECREVASAMAVF